MPSPLNEQPEPTVAEGDVWMECVVGAPDKLVQLYKERREQGIRRYGVPLQRDNGRDHLADAIQELADAVVYFQAARKVELSVQVESLLLKALDQYEHRTLTAMGEAP